MRANLKVVLGLAGFYVAVCAVTIIISSGCEYVAPDVSKALTEQEQSEMFGEQVEQLKELNRNLDRIATALEVRDVLK